MSKLSSSSIQVSSCAWIYARRETWGHLITFTLTWTQIHQRISILKMNWSTENKTCDGRTIQAETEFLSKNVMAEHCKKLRIMFGLIWHVKYKWWIKMRLSFHLRSAQGERNSIHKNLVFCLFIAEVLFLAGIERTDNKVRNYTQTKRRVCSWLKW